MKAPEFRELEKAFINLNPSTSEMIVSKKKFRRHPLEDYIERLQAGDALLPDSPGNVREVVGILKSYGIVLDAYSRNLIYIADHQFLVLFPFF